MRILGTNLPEDAWFNPVAVATTGSNILLSGQQTIDGVVVGQYPAGDPRNLRILVKDNTNAVQNGLYDTNSGTWTRCLDANDKTQWAQGCQVLVTSGTANGGIAYRCTTTPTNGQIIPGTSALTFAISYFASANEMETLTLAMPAEFVVVGSPTSGNNPTVTVTKAAQNANLVYAGPSSGGAVAPSFRAIVAADLPSSVPLAVTNDTNVTASIAGQNLTLGWTSTLTVVRGGTGGGSASGTLLDNITGFASTGFLQRTGAGTYAFIADPISAAHGGTGLATLTAHAVLLGEGTGNVAFATIGTAGRALIDQGAGADPAFTAISGDATLAGSGALTIANSAITLAKMANLAANSVIGNNTGAPAAPIALTQAQLTAMVNPATALLSGALPAWPNNTTTFLRGDGTYATVATLGAGALANPSATIGLTAVNGSATTAMRSDGAPALSQSIVPTWSGFHTFSSGVTMSGNVPALSTVNNQGPLLLQSGGPQLTWISTDSTGYETGTAQAGSATTITLRAGASAVNNFSKYVNATVTITGGTGNGQVRQIASYVGSTKVATISGSNFSPAPDNTSAYSIGRVDYGYWRTIADANCIYYELWESSAPLTGSDGPFGQQDEYFRFNRFIHVNSMNYPLTGNGNRDWTLAANYVWDAESAQTPRNFKIQSLSAATNTLIDAIVVTPNNATPIVSVPNGTYLQGLTSPIVVAGAGGGSGITSNWQLAGSSVAASITALRYTAPGGGGSLFNFGSSRGAAPGTFSAVQSGDGLGSFQFYGDNGTDYTGTSAIFQALADGNFSSTSMPGKLLFRTAKVNAIATTTGLTIDSGQNVVVGTGSAIATNATLGFFYMQTCAGTPTGTPATSYTGSIPMVYDTTNHQFWIYDGAGWKQPKTPAAAAIVTWQ